MRRWVWRVLLAALVLTALTGTALAADPVTLDNGVVLEQDGSNWKVTGYTGSGGRVVIPSRYGTGTVDNVTSIGQEAFKGKRVTEVIIPSSIKTIGTSAFEGCGSLKTVVFFDRTGPAVIGTRAFLGCTGLEDLVMSRGITEIGEEAFGGCLSLGEVVIPDGVTKLGDGAFNQCRKLTAVYIPNSLKNIDEIAFSNANALNSIHFDGTREQCVAAFTSGHLPNGLNSHEHYHPAKYDRIISTTDCESPVNVFGGATCGSANKDDACKNLGKDIELQPLGHDYQVPMDKYNEEAAKHKDCQTWKWEYDVVCSRCGDTVHQERNIPATKEHTWVKKGVLRVVTPATCLNEGLQIVQTQCTECKEFGEREEVIPVRTEHTYTDRTEVYVIRPASCAEGAPKGLQAVYKVCDVCDVLSVHDCAECDSLKAALEAARLGDDKDATTAAEEAFKTHLETDHPDDVTFEDIDNPDHTRPAGTVPDPEESKAATCEADGLNVYKYVCPGCGEERREEETVEKLGHDYAAISDTDPTGVLKEATCTEPGLRAGGRRCTRCGKLENGGADVEIPPLGHLWSSPVIDEKAEGYKAPTCTEDGEGTGTATCTRPGCHSDPDNPDSPPVTETQKITLPALGHDWGEWTVTKEATATEAGSQERVCKRCDGKEIREIPPLGTPVDPDDPDGPDNPDNPDTPEETTYKVDVVQASNGTTTVSRSTAKEGDQITITVAPASGYVLDMIRVIAGGSQLVALTNLGNNQYRFTMPAANVEVRATYDRTGSDYAGNWSNGFGQSGSENRSDPRRTTDVVPVQIQEPVVGAAGAGERLFQDVPTDYWAAGEINWASQMGYMNGTGNRFNPGGNISQQQMWMVLARLTGNQPANMAEARRWAELGGYADGSSPTGPVKRHQLVAALYRCARLSGRAGRTTVSLAGYPDSRLVPTVAREAFTWALTAGVISSDSEGRLKPNDYITRDQFAVILYRYSTRT